MTFSDLDIIMMRRALQLAAAGRRHTSPNPMVGAVITAPDGRIIGEGWHRRFGGPHAEVNAVASVAHADRHLFPESTVYVTLEPCSHYGKTPPCAKMLIECGFRRVVVAAGDPNPKVSGRGIAMLRQAGIRVDQGLLADESRRLNVAFHTAHTLRRPYVQLKWACSADGFIDARRQPGQGAHRFSSPLTATLNHLRRAEFDAIAVGAGTVIADSPALTVRGVAGRSPQPVIFDRHGLVQPDNKLLIREQPAIIIGDIPLADALHSLYADHGITSLLVEGGRSLLQSFIDAGIWDAARVEVTPYTLGALGTVRAPHLPGVPATPGIYTFTSCRI